jgi:hypothetical protein
VHTSAMWYTSGTFWAVISVVVALIGIAVGVTTWLVGAPRRLITYSLPVTTSLLTTDSDRLGIKNPDLAVTYKGKLLKDPYLITLSMDSHSRRDIRSSDFDQNGSLSFEFDTPIIAVVGHPDSAAVPSTMSINGNSVRLAPVLIRRG